MKFLDNIYKMENNQTMKDAKEKAKELVEQFYTIGIYDLYTAKQCAIIASKELANMARIYDNHNISTDKHIYTFNCVLYFEEVEQEIKKL